MKTAVTIGYASIDYPAVLDGYFKADHTVLIKQRPADAFPRPGGCPIYVARPLVTSTCQTSMVTWVGVDDMAERFRSWAARDGIDIAGIATVDSGVTPMCFMIYQEDGSCCCCFDPGLLGQEKLDSTQIALISGADLLAVTVGPPDVGMQALELVADDAAVAWVAKNDPLSYPESLRAALGRRADYVFCNVHEREWIDNALDGRERPDPLIIETNGSEPVKAEFRGEIEFVDVPTLCFNDASGAGDTLAGGCLAAIAGGETSPELIAAAGIAASTALLKTRSTVG
ncbi:MAG: carbohydrate kinase family protein [Gammaproteobacteria bacterium]|nr:carbohydrate kinase family protein [Gammaproteobacteria bacterium]